MTLNYKSRHRCVCDHSLVAEGCPENKNESFMLGGWVIKSGDKKGVKDGLSQVRKRGKVLEGDHNP